MTFSQRKPYAVAIATMQDGTRVPVKLEVDLGHVLGLSLIPGSAQGIRVPDASVASEGAGLSGVVRRRLGRIRALEFGSIRLNNVVCSFSLSGYETTAERQGVLGVGMLSRFRLIMDYPGKRMILEPTAKTHEPVEVDMSGVTFWPHGDTFIAKRVRDDSPASMTGIREGDLLVHLDGAPAARLRLRDIDERLRRGDGEQTRMAIRRDGAELELVLTLRKRI